MCYDFSSNFLAAKGHIRIVQSVRVFLIGILSHYNILFWRPKPQFSSFQVTDSEAGIIGKGNNIPQDIRY